MSDSRAALIIVAALYVASTTYATGACVAYFDGKYPGAGSHRETLGACALGGMIPVVGPIVATALGGFLEYGWRL